MTERVVTRHPFLFALAGSALLCFMASLQFGMNLLSHQSLADFALFAIGLGLLLVHGVAAYIGFKRKRIGKAVWILASSQIIGAILLPFFIEDALRIAPFLLVLIPLEICLAYRLSGIPTAIFFCLFGASAVLAIDLYKWPNRLTLMERLPFATQLIPITLSMLLVYLAILVYYHRMRPSSPYFARLNLVSTQTLATVGSATLVVLLVTAVLIVQIRRVQTQEIGQNYQALAAAVGERVGNSLEQEILSLLELGQNEVIQETLERADQSYPAGIDEAVVQLEANERRWKQADPAFVRDYRSNPAVLVMASFRRNQQSHDNLALIDRRGGLVAAQGVKPKDFNYRKRRWWQIAWNEGLGDRYLGNLQMDSHSGLATVEVAVAVISKKSQKTIGVIRSTFEIRSIQANLIDPRDIAGEKVLLINSEGQVIAGSDKDARKEKGWPEWVHKAFKPKQVATDMPEGWFLKAFAEQPSGWLLIDAPNGAPVVMGHSHPSTTSRVNVEPLQLLGWRVLLFKNQDHALAGVTRSTKLAILVGLVALAIGVLHAAGIARVFASSVQSLTRTALAITGGDLEKRVSPTGPEEMVTLGEAFNTLTTRLQDTIEDLRHTNRTLEQKVLERTEKLRRTQKTLIDGAHYSGMAEIVSGILHNLGNVLNSINVSVETTAGIIRNSKLPKLKRVNDLLKEHQDDLSEFLSHDAKGMFLLNYLLELSDNLQRENEHLEHEFELIKADLDVVRESLMAQRKYAKDVSVVESLDINELLIDILHADSDLVDYSKIQVEQDFSELEKVLAPRTKLSYAILSLIENAEYAMRGNGPKGKTLRFTTQEDPDGVRLTIEDNGCGIDPNNLVKIFQYGFTTKPDGNGFGLHTCANAVREMGGRVWAESEGHGMGTRIQLILPTRAQLKGIKQFGVKISEHME